MSEGLKENLFVTRVGMPDDTILLAPPEWNMKFETNDVKRMVENRRSLVEGMRTAPMHIIKHHANLGFDSV